MTAYRPGVGWTGVTLCLCLEQSGVLWSRNVTLVPLLEEVLLEVGWGDLRTSSWSVTRRGR